MNREDSTLLKIVRQINCKYSTSSLFKFYDVNIQKMTLRSQLFVLIVTIFYDSQATRYFTDKLDLYLMPLCGFLVHFAQDLAAKSFIPRRKNTQF